MCRLENQALPKGFNSRAREGRDPPPPRPYDPTAFQFTRPRGARHSGGGLSVVHVVSINAPARGATGCGPIAAPPNRVSIHAPARGATDMAHGDCADTFVSIHAPARGATRNMIQSAPASMFQFTRPRGARHAASVLVGRSLVSIHAPARGATDSVNKDTGVVMVSIHAPARGATPTRKPRRPRKKFQFTRPRGARLGGCRAWITGGVFQFTRPRGARLAPACPSACPRRFNSRAREGRDIYSAGLRRRDTAFQFTRPRGARPG